MKYVVFWQNIPSIHQSALIRNLAETDGIEVCVAVAENVPERRLRMGWNVPDFGKARLLVSPTEKMTEDLLRRDDKNSVHVFSGFKAYSFVRNALFKACKTSALLGVGAEIPDPRGLKGILRKAVYTFEALRYFCNRIDFILAIGSRAPNWYATCGYPMSVLYPFAYFVEKPLLSHSDKDVSLGGHRKIYQLVFIGSLIHRKGVDLLLKALAEVPGDQNWKLSVVGDGPERKKLEKLMAGLGIDRGVSFKGSLPNNQAMELLARADLLVLPSRYDGWGAVVNEALMLGTPVVCSDNCGASVLVGDEKRGYIFPAGSVHELGKVLYQMITRGKLTPELRKEIRNWSRCIDGWNAAKYFREIVSHCPHSGDSEMPLVSWLCSK